MIGSKDRPPRGASDGEQAKSAKPLRSFKWKRVHSVLLAAAAMGAFGTAMAAYETGPPGKEHAWGTPTAIDGITPSAIDPTVGACENFYRHACGGFIRSTPVDGARPVAGMADRRFDSNLDGALTRLFKEAGGTDDPELRRLQTFYSACSASVDGADQADGAVMESWLARINAASTPAEIQAVMRELAQIGADAFFNYGGRPDRANWARYRGEIHNVRPWADAVVVERAFTLSGQEPPEARRDAKAVADITEVLKAHAGSRWDSEKGENPLSIDQIAAIAPSIEWKSYFALVGASGDVVNVTSPDYLKTVEEQLTTRSAQELRAYLRWTFLLSMRGELPRPYDQAFGDVIPPLRVPLGDSKARCRESTVRAMGVEFSRQFATRILGWDARATGKRLSETIRQAVVESVANRTWLSASARSATVEKLRKTDLKIGFPDQWPEVGSFALSQDRFLDNVLAARRFEQAREWKRAHSARSATDWEMKVYPWAGEGMAAARLALPNGYPDAYSNSLIMTAAFLMPPNLDPEVPIEVNYATFGTVFAHELVHVAQQHTFGADGRDAELWRQSDQTAAQARGQCVVKQASGFQPLPGVAMNGDHQFEENVADLGGLRLAHEALQKRLGAGMNKPDATGMTPAKRFFYAYAQHWCAAQTADSLRASVSVDGHAPPEFRVNGPLSNLPAFARTFSCRPTAKMVRGPSKQCVVW